MPAVFAEWLRERRRQLDMTQRELASAVSCTPSLIIKLERGERRPSREVAGLLAERLAVLPVERERFLMFARGLSDLAPAPLVARAAGALPQPEVPLLGREAELAHTERLFAEGARLVTLAGPGGVGKTRLAIELAHRSLLPGGAVYVALAALATPAQVAAAVAAELGRVATGRVDPVALVLEQLHKRPTLLVLDNFEHLLSDDPDTSNPALDLLAAILAETPETQLLVTSRVRLNLRAEWVVLLDGLETPSDENVARDSPAVQIFLRTAHPAAQDRQAAAHIARLVGGLPLALELAAAATHKRSLAGITRELTRSLDLLARETNGQVRHRSVRAVFDQSWGLLNEGERTLLARLALFPAAFTYKAATRVALATPQRLDGLVRRSLLRREQGGHYSLHPLIRRFSHERFEALADATETNRRYIAYYLAWAMEAGAQVNGAGQAGWLAAFTDELDNLRFAIALAAADPEQRSDGARICVELRRFWGLRGLAREGMRLAEELLVGALPPELRANLLVTVSNLARLLGDYQRARGAAEAALALYPPGAANVGRAGALTAVGVLAMELGENETARSYLEEALPLWRVVGSTFDMAVASNNLANVRWIAGDLAGARRLFAEGCAAAQRGDHLALLALMQSNLGMMAALEGDAEGAAAAAAALPALRAAGNHRGVAYALETLAARAGLYSDHRRGVLLLGAAAALRKQAQTPRTPADEPYYARLAALARGPLDQALFDEAFAEGRALSLEQAEALALQ